MDISNQQSNSITATKILWEGLKLPAKNWNLLLPISILSLLPSLLSYIFIYLSITSLLPDFPANSLSSIPWKEICTVGFLLLAASFLIKSLLTITTIHILSTTYSTNTPSTLNTVLSTLNRSLIKGSMITVLYIALFQVCYVFLLALSIVVALWFFNRAIFVIIATIVALVVALRWYLYLIVVWSTSVVISVANEGCYGLEGIKKAGELLRGRRWQSIRIVYMETFAFGLVFEAYNLATGFAPRSKVAGLVVGVGQVAILEASHLFLWSVYTVYYHECRKIDEESAISGSLMYVPVPSHVDDA